MPAHMTAKMVMASAARFTAVRQRWRSRNRMAEMSVPAWPMPIHQTKFTMSQAHITGSHIAPNADAGGNLVSEHEHQHSQRHQLGMNSAHHQNGAAASVKAATWLDIQPNPR